MRITQLCHFTRLVKHSLVAETGRDGIRCIYSQSLIPGLTHVCDRISVSPSSSSVIVIMFGVSWQTDIQRVYNDTNTDTYRHINTYTKIHINLHASIQRYIHLYTDTYNRYIHTYKGYMDQYKVTYKH